MNKIDTLNQYKEIILKIINQYLPQSKVILYGSRARKTNKEGADIDIALDNNASIDIKVFFKIKSDIQDSPIPVFVDVVDVHAISDDMKKQIIEDGVMWKN